MASEQIQIEESWKAVLQDEFNKPYFGQIREYLLKERQNGKTIYPPGPLIFNAFNTTPFALVKVVVIGQDPYHGEGQAMGLSFSVPKGVAIPASLLNIYKELQADVGFKIPAHGDLTAWAKQGVFMLNAILTVEEKLPGSHKAIGWQMFTDAVISKLSELKDGLVFLLWGKFAQSKVELIDELRHYVLTAAHPSPLAGGAFMGNRHFSRTNEILSRQGHAPINWAIE